MEMSVLFMGPVGAGKSRAVTTISDIPVVNTDMLATDETAQLKSHTTVAMDVGVLNLPGGDKLRLVGAPGQDRFDFMWDILLMQCRGVGLFINHSSPTALDELDHYLQAIEERLLGRAMPLVVGVTHVDQNPDESLDRYRRHLAARSSRLMPIPPPVFEVDARNREQVFAMLAAMLGLLEMAERFPMGQRRSVPA